MILLRGAAAMGMNFLYIVTSRSDNFPHVPARIRCTIWKSQMDWASVQRFHPDPCPTSDFVVALTASAVYAVNRSNGNVVWTFLSPVLYPPPRATVSSMEWCLFRYNTALYTVWTSRLVRASGRSLLRAGSCSFDPSRRGLTY